jgi:hypothetical protein
MRSDSHLQGASRSSAAIQIEPERRGTTVPFITSPVEPSSRALPAGKIPRLRHGHGLILENTGYPSLPPCPYALKSVHPWRLKTAFGFFWDSPKIKLEFLQTPKLEQTDHTPRLQVNIHIIKSRSRG